jgi:hypothetical protein
MSSLYYDRVVSQLGRLPLSSEAKNHGKADGGLRKAIYLDGNKHH